MLVIRLTTKKAQISWEETVPAYVRVVGRCRRSGYKLVPLEKATRFASEGEAAAFLATICKSSGPIIEPLL